MELFYQAPTPDAQKIRDSVCKGYRIQNPEKPHGYAGTFLFSVPDVYITDRIATRVKLNPSFKDDLLKMLDRFCHDDYGFVTFAEHYNNGETRYLCGSSSLMIARYGGPYGGVVYETFFDISLFYFIEEDPAEFWDQQERKRQEWCRSTGYEPVPFTRDREIHYYRGQ